MYTQCSFFLYCIGIVFVAIAQMKMPWSRTQVPTQLNLAITCLNVSCYIFFPSQWPLHFKTFQQAIEYGSNCQGRAERYFSIKSAFCVPCECCMPMFSGSRIVMQKFQVQFSYFYYMVHRKQGLFLFLLFFSLNLECFIRVYFFFLTYSVFFGTNRWCQTKDWGLSDVMWTQVSPASGESAALIGTPPVL